MPESKPDYRPSYRIPVWLSSDDVLNAIDQVANDDKALSNGQMALILWDMRFAILNLIRKEHEK